MVEQARLHVFHVADGHVQNDQLLETPQHGDRQVGQEQFAEVQSAQRIRTSVGKEEAPQSRFDIAMRQDVVGQRERAEVIESFHTSLLNQTDPALGQVQNLQGRSSEMLEVVSGYQVDLVSTDVEMSEAAEKGISLVDGDALDLVIAEIQNLEIRREMGQIPWKSGQ